MCIVGGLSGEHFAPLSLELSSIDVPLGNGNERFRMTYHFLSGGVSIGNTYPIVFKWG